MSSLLDEISKKFGPTYGPAIKAALKDGIEANETPNLLKKRLLETILGPSVPMDQEQINAVFDLVIVAEWITFRK